MDTVKLVLTNSKFWTAMFVLVNATVHYFLPDFPETIWVGVDAVYFIVMGLMLQGDVRAKILRKV